MTTTISISGTAPYDVVVGHGLAPRLPTLVGDATTVAVIIDRAIESQSATVVDALAGAGRAVHRRVIDGGEPVKAIEVAVELWDWLGDIRLTRTDVIVAIGGGATTDLVGFVAATWLRGVRVVHVPTTLLAMVDAAVGGKTGINTRAGKNLVGAFHPPAGVVVDLDLLAELPAPQWANGMAEVVKAGFIADPRILDLVDDDPVGARDGTTAHARELIERAIAVKARVVGEDLRDVGLRESLNYGHTLGHAIERVANYSVPHGHAISVGMVFAGALGRLSGTLDESAAARHREMLDAIGLPVSYAGAAWPDLLDAMRIDKKARGATLRFVVLNGIGATTILTDPPPALLDSAYLEVAR